MQNRGYSMQQETVIKRKVCLVDFQGFKTPPVAEIKALLDDLKYEIVQTFTFQARNRKFIGKGQLQMIADFINTEEESITCGKNNDNKCIVVYNNILTGLNYKILETACKTQILSRIDVIIEIFQSRALTVEAKLQVRLAQLLHGKTKLIKLWTHLEKQKGGTNTVGGPGETQFEMDKRMIEDAVIDIKRKLIKIKDDSKLRQEGRQDKVIALVGYSNAGKTSLFNTITQGNAKVSSKPFETLDPFMRQCVLSNAQKIIVSDTVGFVSFLPPFLIQAFRSTLENITQADLLLFIIDASVTPYNLAEVMNWLKMLKVLDVPMIYVWNKVDLLTQEMRDYIDKMDLDSVKVSSITGEGVKELMKKVSSQISDMVSVRVTCSADSPIYAWLFKQCIPTNLVYQDEEISLDCQLSKENYNRLVKMFTAKHVIL